LRKGARVSEVLLNLSAIFADGITARPGMINVERGWIHGPRERFRRGPDVLLKKAGNFFRTSRKLVPENGRDTKAAIKGEANGQHSISLMVSFVSRRPLRW
jgi:hypothetical protein